MMVVVRHSINPLSEKMTSSFNKLPQLNFYTFPFIHSHPELTLFYNFFDHAVSHW